MAVSQRWPQPVRGSLGHKARRIAHGAQHTQTLTNLSSICSPDEDSCQKFVPFVGVSVLRGQQAIGAGGGGRRGEVHSPADAGDHLSHLSLQVVKVGLVEQSFSASGESLGTPSPWLLSPLRGGPCWYPSTPPTDPHSSSPVDSDDATVCTPSLLSSAPAAGGAAPYGKETVSTPPPSPSVSSGLSGAG